jgi:hypothetical protein
MGRVSQRFLAEPVYAVSRLLIMDPMRAGRLQNSPLLVAFKIYRIINNDGTSTYIIHNKQGSISPDQLPEISG